MIDTNSLIALAITGIFTCAIFALLINILFGEHKGE
jgi:hypothetical protein